MKTPGRERWKVKTKITGLGDVVAIPAQAIAGGVDRVLGTNLKGCQGCKGRRERLNKAFPINTG